MISRRKWFGLMAAAPVALPAFALAKAREGDQPVRNLLTLQMQSDLWRPSKDDPRINMSIGKDGALWVSQDGENWRRVVTE